MHHTRRPNYKTIGTHQSWRCWWSFRQYMSEFIVACTCRVRFILIVSVLYVLCPFCTDRVRPVLSVYFLYLSFPSCISRVCPVAMVSVLYFSCLSSIYCGRPVVFVSVSYLSCPSGTLSRQSCTYRVYFVHIAFDVLLTYTHRGTTHIRAQHT